MMLKYFIPVIALATAANAFPFKVAPYGDFGWLWADSKPNMPFYDHEHENSDFGLRGQLGAIARKTIVADLFVQTGIVAGGAFVRFPKGYYNHSQIIRGNFGIPLAVVHRNFHAEIDFTAGVSYNITENNELGIKLTIRPNETALGVSYNYWIF